MGGIITMRVNKLSVSVEQQAEMEYQASQTEKQKMQMEDAAKKMVYNAVRKGWITAEEYKEITGEDYE